MQDNEKQTTPGCQFDKAWIGKCKKPIGPGMTMCEEHAKLKCCSCGAPATRECSETMGLVCGADLCDNCEHTICDNGCNNGGHLPPGLKGHCKKSEQVYKPWWMKESPLDIKTTPRNDAPVALDVEKIVIKEEYTFYAPKGFFKAQVETAEGYYTLKRVKLEKIDVVYKGIAKRSFFDWDKTIDSCIDGIIENFEKTPPVILEEFEGRLYSVDGHHRITGALELGKSEIQAFVIKVNQLTYPRN